MKIIETDAIVIKEKRLLKNDSLVTLFTKKLGKIKVVTKGVKKITSRRLSHIDTGNLIKAFLYQKKDVYYLQQTLLRSSFSLLKVNQVKIKCLFFVLFLLDRLLPENQEENKIYFLTLNYLSQLARQRESFKNLLNYSNQLSFHLGYGKKFADFNSLKIFIQETISEEIPTID